MRILIQGMNYAPEVTGIGPFTTGLAEFLAGRGHGVVVSTTFPHYPQWAVQPPYAGRWRAVEHTGGVEVRRAPVALPRRGSAVQRILYDSSLAAGTFLNSVSLRPVDVVLCVVPPVQVALTGAAIARLKGARLVLLVQDLPLDAAVAVGMLRRGAAYAVGRAMEKVAYTLAHRIIVISNAFRDRIITLGVHPEKLALIPNWANTDAIRPMPAEPTIRSELGAGPDDFLVLHTGNMGEKQGLRQAIRAAALAPAGNGFTLTLVGDGSDRSGLEDMVSRQGLVNVSILPLQSAERFPLILAAADALLLSQRANVIDSVAPSKLLSYMAAGRPVIAAVHLESEAAAVVRAAGCGVVVAPEDPAALAGAIASLAGDTALRARLGASGRAFVEENYARDRVLARYEDFFAETSGSKGSLRAVRL